MHRLSASPANAETFREETMTPNLSLNSDARRRALPTASVAG